MTGRGRRGEMTNRRPTPDELRLLGELLNVAGLEDREQWLAELHVRGMDDGGMGSLNLSNGGREDQARQFCRELAAVEFTDADGVVVIATLYADMDGEPFELDMWKTDFSPLVRIASSFRSWSG